MTLLLLAAMTIMPFNDGWEFQRKGDRCWSATSVPHDAAYGMPLSRNEDHDHGFVPSPETRYRKSFARPAGEGRFSLKFDGVYMDSQVFVNGCLAGGYAFPKHDQLSRIQAQCRIDLIRLAPAEGEAGTASG